MKKMMIALFILLIVTPSISTVLHAQSEAEIDAAIRNAKSSTADISELMNVYNMVYLRNNVDEVNNTPNNIEFLYKFTEHSGYNYIIFFTNQSTCNSFLNDTRKEKRFHFSGGSSLNLKLLYRGSCTKIKNPYYNKEIPNNSQGTSHRSSYGTSQRINDHTETAISGVEDIEKMNEEHRNTDDFGNAVGEVKGTESAKIDDDDFYEHFLPQKEKSIQIGLYQNQPVLKRGDTVITKADNKKYLLSRQLVVGGKHHKYYEFIPENSSLIKCDITGNINPIGYVTGSGDKSALGRPYMENSEDNTFYEFVCDEATYEKFLAFCNWQICKMENSVNVFTLSYNDYEKVINEDLELNKKIIGSKFADIFIQVGVDNLENFGVLGKIKKAINSNGGNAKEVINALEKYGIDPNTSLQDKLIEDGIGLLTSPYGNEEATNIAKQFAACNKTMAASFNNVINGKSNEVVGDKTIAGFVQDLVRGEDYNKLETEIAGKIKTYRNALFCIVDDCLPQKASASLKRCWMYHAIKNSPEFGEAIGLISANITIKYKVSKEFKDFLQNHIVDCRNKKQSLEKYKHKYQTLIGKSQNNCLTFTQSINQLQHEVFYPGGTEYDVEVLELMQKYVFGNEKMGFCQPLVNTEIRGRDKGKTQPIKDVNPNRIAVFIHGAAADATTWIQNEQSINTLLEIVNTQRCDAKFSWNTHWYFNDFETRQQVVQSLTQYISQYSGEYKELVLIGHSHGGNVAIQAINSITGFENIMLLTIATPAYNCDELVIQETKSGNELKENWEPNNENPKNITNPNFNMHIHVYNDKDKVAGTIISSITDKGCVSEFFYKPSNITKNIRISCDAKFGHSIQQSNECLKMIKQKIGNKFKPKSSISTLPPVF